MGLPADAEAFKFKRLQQLGCSWPDSNVCKSFDGLFADAKTKTLLERDEFCSNRHAALCFFLLSMIFSENRYPLFRIMV